MSKLAYLLVSILCRLSFGNGEYYGQTVKPIQLPIYFIHRNSCGATCQYSLLMLRGFTVLLPDLWFWV